VDQTTFDSKNEETGLAVLYTGVAGHQLPKEFVSDCVVFGDWSFIHHDMVRWRLGIGWGRSLFEDGGGAAGVFRLRYFGIKKSTAGSA
jgi:hypothetical protein